MDGGGDAPGHALGRTCGVPVPRRVPLCFGVSYARTFGEPFAFAYADTQLDAVPHPCFDPDPDPGAYTYIHACACTHVDQTSGPHAVHHVDLCSGRSDRGRRLL